MIGCVCVCVLVWCSVGLALLAGGVALLAWNEARVVRTARSLSESLDIVVDAPVDKILLHNEAKVSMRMSWG